MEDALIVNAVVFDSDGIMCSSFMGDVDYLHDVYVASFEECPNRCVEKVRNGYVLFDHMQVIVDEKIVLEFKDFVTLPFADFIADSYGDNFKLQSVEDTKFASFLRKAQKKLGFLPVRGKCNA